MLPLLALLAASPSPSSIVDAREGAPALAVILTPRTATAALGVSELRRALERAIDASNALYLRPDDPSLESCEGRVSCVVAAIGPQDAPKILLVVATRADGYLVPRAFDFATAQRVAGGATDAEADMAIVDGALLARAPTERPSSPARLDTLLSDLLRQTVAAYRARDTLPELGALAVSTGVSGATIEVVGAPLAISSSTAPALFRGLRPGPRDVRVVHPAFLDTTARPTVESGTITAVELRLVPLATPFPHRVVWPTAALIALGSASIALGAARTPGIDSVCSAASCGGGPARLFDGADGGGSGPLAIPLGASLVAAGLTYAIAELALGDDAPAWLPSALALGVASSSYLAAELAH